MSLRGNSANRSTQKPLICRPDCSLCSMNYLGDRAVASIADALRHPTCRLKMVNLRYNQVPEGSLEKISKSHRARTIYLCVTYSNDSSRRTPVILRTPCGICSGQISMEGVRELAKAVEGCRRQEVAHVYVHREGRIDVLGRRTGNSDIREVVCSVAVSPLRRHCSKCLLVSKGKTSTKL